MSEVWQPISTPLTGELAFHRMSNRQIITGYWASPGLRVIER